MSAHGTARDARHGVHALASFERSTMDYDSKTRASGNTGFARALPVHFEHRARKRACSLDSVGRTPQIRLSRGFTVVFEIGWPSCPS